MSPNVTTPNTLAEHLEAYAKASNAMVRAVKSMDIDDLCYAADASTRAAVGIFNALDGRLARIEAAIERRPPPNHTTAPVL